MDTILFFDFFHHLGNIAGVVLYFYGQGQGCHAVDRNTLVDRQNICLINELGKNWDSGVSSLYFTYKQDENGDWKFCS